MSQKGGLCWGAASVCVVPLAWVLFFLLCGSAASDGEGMFVLSVLVLPLMGAGTVMSAVWLWRMRRRCRKRDRLPWLIAAVNMNAVLAGLPMVLAGIPGYMSLLLE